MSKLRYLKEYSWIILGVLLFNSILLGYLLGSINNLTLDIKMTYVITGIVSGIISVFISKNLVNIGKIILPVINLIVLLSILVISFMVFDVGYEYVILFTSNNIGLFIGLFYYILRNIKIEHLMESVNNRLNNNNNLFNTKILGDAIRSKFPDISFKYIKEMGLYADLGVKNNRISGTIIIGKTMPVAVLDDIAEFKIQKKDGTLDPIFKDIIEEVKKELGI